MKVCELAELLYRLDPEAQFVDTHDDPITGLDVRTHQVRIFTEDPYSDIVTQYSKLLLLETTVRQRYFNELNGIPLEVIRDYVEEHT